MSPSINVNCLLNRTMTCASLWLYLNNVIYLQGKVAGNACLIRMYGFGIAHEVFILYLQEEEEEEERQRTNERKELLLNHSD